MEQEQVEDKNENREPSKEEFQDLCQTVKGLITPHNDILGGEDTWYLIIISVLCLSPRLNLLASFYQYLIENDTKFQNDPTKLSLQIRDIFQKLIPIIGAPQILCILSPFVKVEGNVEKNATESELSEKWKNIDVKKIQSRGQKTINTIYGDKLLPQIFQSFGKHKKDIEFTEIFSIYGLYLSDFTILSSIQTEIIIYSTILCTGLKSPSLWHTRGLGRLLGARGIDESDQKVIKAKEYIRLIKVVVITIVEFIGKDMIYKTGLERDEGWVNVGDVLRELGGWGDDPI